MAEDKKHPELSEREQQLITLAALGLTDIAIANRLEISEPTVKSYWGRIRSKMGPCNRTELVAHALREESENAIQELNEEIDRLRTALERTHREPLDLQLEILENAPDAVFAIDQHACFVWLNLEAERMFGYRFDEIVGNPVSILVPVDLHDRHQLHMQQYFGKPERKHMGEHLATVAVRKDGEIFSIAATLASIETPNGRLVTCFIREITGSQALISLAERYGAKLK